jgi:hypothetical protein
MLVAPTCSALTLKTSLRVRACLLGTGTTPPHMLALVCCLLSQGYSSVSHARKLERLMVLAVSIAGFPSTQQRMLFLTLYFLWVCVYLGIAKHNILDASSAHLGWSFAKAHTWFASVSTTSSS